MSSKGLIYLYDSDSNTPVDIKKYQDRQKRKKIIESWEKKYAHAYYRCYIIIAPKMPSEYDYDTLEKQLDSIVKTVKPTKFERPKAEYKSIYNTESPYKYD